MMSTRHPVVRAVTGASETSAGEYGVTGPRDERIDQET